MFFSVKTADMKRTNGLGSARCAEFETVEGRTLAIRNLNRLGIEAQVVIGGNGSQTGAHLLNQMGFPTVGVASTIDNDLVGSEMTIGVDTGLTHLSAILGMPTIELYCDSPRWKTEGYWSSKIHNLGDKGQPPSADEVIAIIQSNL